MIRVRKQLSWVKRITVVWAVYGVAWISLEGLLWRVVVMGVSTTTVVLLHLLQRTIAARPLALRAWLGTTAVFGLLWGSGSVVFTLLAMAFKTGLHAHGPEFTVAEISWVVAQLPLWSLVGLLGGLAIGLLTAATTTE